MIISTKKGTPQVELDRIIDSFEKQGLSVTLIRGTDYNVFGLVGDTTKIDEKDVLANPWVENVTVCPRPTSGPTACSTRRTPSSTWAAPRSAARIAVMAGPCSVEGEEQIKHCPGREGRRRHCSAAAPTSPAPLPTPSRAWAPRASGHGEGPGSHRPAHRQRADGRGPHRRV